MTSIPRELLPKILAKIGLRDKATLLACHAVSRDLRIATRAILFSNIILELPPDDPTKELQDFYEFVAARPYVGTSIRHLRINGTTGGVLEDAEVEDTDGDYHERAQAARGHYNCNVDITPLYRTLPLLDKIETLKLYHVLPPSSVDRTSIQAIRIHVPEVSIAIPSFDSEEEVEPWDPDDVYKEEVEEQEREDIRGTKLLFNILNMFDSIGKLSIMTRPHVFDLVNYLGVDDTPPLSIPSQLKVDCLWLESGNDTFWKYFLKLQFVRELHGVEIGWNIREENVRRLHDVVRLSSATLEYLKLRAIHKYGMFLNLFYEERIDKRCYHRQTILICRPAATFKHWQYTCISTLSHSWISLPLSLWQAKMACEISKS